MRIARSFAMSVVSTTGIGVEIDWKLDEPAQPIGEPALP
jgi:hypothetical protein